MIQLMRDLVIWEHQTILSLEHGDSANLVTGGAVTRMSVVLWKKCIDITDLLKVSQVGAAAGATAGAATGATAGEASGQQGRAADVDGESFAGMQLRTAGEILQVLLGANLFVTFCVGLVSLFGLIQCFVLCCLVFRFRFVFISNVAGTRRHESQAVLPLFLLSLLLLLPLFLLSLCPIDLLRVMQIHLV
jgi:hypothetical protein